VQHAQLTTGLRVVAYTVCTSKAYLLFVSKASYVSDSTRDLSVFNRVLALSSSGKLTTSIFSSMYGCEKSRCMLPINDIDVCPFVDQQLDRCYVRGLENSDVVSFRSLVAILSAPLEIKCFTI
jgi:hypothetical protein